MQARKDNSKFPNLVFITVPSVLIGIVIGKAINFKYFKIEEKIDLIELLSVAVTIFAAYFVTKVLDKEKQDTRTAKDLIIRRTEDLYQLIESSHNIASTGSINYTDAAAHMKRIRTNLRCIYELTSDTDISIKSSDKETIQESIAKLRDLLTDTPKINDTTLENLPIEVKESIVHLNKGRLFEIEKEYDNLKNRILLLQLSINKA